METEFQRQQQLKKEEEELQRIRAVEQIKRQKAEQVALVEEEKRRKDEYEKRVARINNLVLTTVQENDEEELIRLLEGGADVNVLNRLQRTPLTLAVMKDSVSIIRILLSYGADVNAPDLYNQTPLSFAIKYKRHACFELMAHSKKGNPTVGAFMYQRKLENDVELHRQDMEEKRIEQIKQDLLYKSSRKKPKKDKYPTQKKSEENISAAADR